MNRRLPVALLILAAVVLLHLLSLTLRDTQAVRVASALLVALSGTAVVAVLGLFWPGRRV